MKFGNQQNLLDLLDPKKTTSPITSLPKLDSTMDKESPKSIKERTCSTKSSDPLESISLFESSQTSEGNKFHGKEKNVQQSKPRNGDWVCLICGNHNYSFRETCNRCQKQTKAQNFEQTLQIYNNPQLKGGLLKNQVMAQRIEFNFCYSLHVSQPNQMRQRTINNNVISGTPRNQPFSLPGNPQPFQVRPSANSFYPVQPQNFQMIPNQYMYPSMPHNMHKQMGVQTPPGYAPAFRRYQMNPPTNYPFMQGVRPQVHTDSGFIPNSKFSAQGFNLTDLNPQISPLNTFNYNSIKNQKIFKKGTINSDICHDKSISQIKNLASPMDNMQMNLVDKFKEMRLIPKNTPKENEKKKENRQNRKPFSSLKNYKKVKPLNSQKENKKKTFKGNKNQYSKLKRYGKLKYKAVTPKENKENNQKTTNSKANGSKKDSQNKNVSKSMKSIFKLPMSSSKASFYEKKNEDTREQIEKAEELSIKSPSNSYFKSIFNSQLLFDFETPKKQKNNCFLNFNSIGKDSDIKNENQFSERGNKILKLFAQSEDENEEENSTENQIQDFNEKEFVRLMAEMKQ